MHIALPLKNPMYEILCSLQRYYMAWVTYVSALYATTCLSSPLKGIGMADAVEQAPQKAGGIECRPVGPSDVLCAPDEPLTAQSGAQLPQRPIILVHLPASVTSWLSSAAKFRGRTNVII